MKRVECTVNNSELLTLCLVLHHRNQSRSQHWVSMEVTCKLLKVIIALRFHRVTCHYIRWVTCGLQKCGELHPMHNTTYLPQRMTQFPLMKSGLRGKPNLLINHNRRWKKLQEKEEKSNDIDSYTRMSSFICAFARTTYQSFMDEKIQPGLLFHVTLGQQPQERVKILLCFILFTIQTLYVLKSSVERKARQGECFLLWEPEQKQV